MMFRLNELHTITQRKSWKILVGAAVSLSAAIGTAQAAPSCSSDIAACGCAITSSGYYLISANLINPGAGICVDIKAPNTVLEFARTTRGIPATMQGHSGEGTGILIEDTAQFTVVAGIKQLQNLPTVPFGVAAPGLPASGELGAPPVVGNEGSIVGFQYAIEDDASNTIIEYFNHLNSNSIAGIYIYGADHVTAGNFCADLNSVAGVLVVGATYSRVFDFTAEQNMVDGVMLRNSDSNALYNFTTVYNTLDGVLLQDSSQNSISPASSSSNGDTGIHIGCGPNSVCKEISDSNHVTANAAQGLFTGDVSNCDILRKRPPIQPVGILIEEGNSTNIIAGNTATGNTTSGRTPVGRDLEDDNSDCGTDIWTNNIFTNLGTITPPCTGNP